MAIFRLTLNGQIISKTYHESSMMERFEENVLRAKDRDTVDYLATVQLTKDNKVIKKYTPECNLTPAQISGLRARIASVLNWIDTVSNVEVGADVKRIIGASEGQHNRSLDWREGELKITFEVGSGV